LWEVEIMKIGSFSKKYGINPSAVRFYVDKALLTPKRENGQYIFDDICGKQMEKILKYKRYRFSLEEISLLFYYEQLSNLKDDKVVDEIINLLAQKRDTLNKELVSVDAITKDIDDEIDRFENLKNKPESMQSNYVPLSSFEMLCCPVCGSDLRLEDAVVEVGGIQKASVKCNCGYSVTIEDGVILCPEHTKDSPFRLFENVDSVIATTSEIGPSFRGLLEKGHLRLYQQILRICNYRHNALVGPLTYNFILGYMNSIPNVTTIGIVDPSLNKIKKMKEYLSNSEKDILFVAGDIRKAPFKKETIDLYIDDFSFSNCVVTYNMNLFDVISPLMKDDGKVIGHFFDCSKAPKSLKNIKLVHPDFEPESLSLSRTYTNISNAGLKIIEKTNLGCPQGKEKDFTGQVDNEKVSLITYVAEKRKA